MKLASYLAGENILEKALPKVQSRSLGQIAGSNCLKTEADSEGRGTCGTILRSFQGNYSHVIAFRKI